MGSKTDFRGFPGQKVDILKYSEQNATLQCTRITRTMLVLPLFYYAQNMILHIMLIFPKPKNYAENYTSLIRQTLVREPVRTVRVLLDVQCRLSYSVFLKSSSTWGNYLWGFTFVILSLISCNNRHHNIGQNCPFDFCDLK